MIQVSAAMENPPTIERRRRIGRALGALPDYARSYIYSALHLYRHRTRRHPPAILDGIGIDLVTVVFRPELDLLSLQARSFHRFLDPAFDGTIFVVVNDLRCRAVVEQIELNVRAQYGRWCDRVRVVPFHEIAYRLDPSNGWILQQALKLGFARFVERPHYVVFDAKNHLVAPTAMSRFVDADGFALQTFTRDAAYLPQHQETCAHYFANVEVTRPQFVPMTPFVFDTRSVRDLVSHIEAREKARLADFFCDTRLISEFLLYGSYLESRPGGAASLYKWVDCKTVTLWPGDDIVVAIANVHDWKAFCFGVHREYLAAIKAPEKDMLEGYWRRIGLLSQAETLAGLSATACRVTASVGKPLDGGDARDPGAE